VKVCRCSYGDLLGSLFMVISGEGLGVQILRRAEGGGGGGDERWKGLIGEARKRSGLGRLVRDDW